MHIKGHSGCDLAIRKIGQTTIVTKSTAQLGYINRLKKQAAKQRMFRTLDYENIHIPNVYGELEVQGYYSFDMEYCDGLSFVSFFEVADKNSLNWFYKTVENFIRHSLDQSRPGLIEKSLVIDKINQVESGCRKEVLHSYQFFDHFEALRNFFSKVEEIILPIGPTHGDLTLSNMMINDQKSISLFDFLDSFIESPLLDIIKLRQDTMHHWSLNMISVRTDLTRLRILFEYLDNMIKSSFGSMESFQNFYSPFQILNLLRILPYAKSNSVVEYLNSQINVVRRSALI